MTLIDFPMGMEQLTVDREVPLRRLGVEERAAAERAARESLRAQVAKLECELSGIVAGGFPHVSAVPALPLVGPRLLTLAELERLRDRLALRVHQARGQATGRGDLHRRSKELLERMKLEPGRYKFVRLPVVDLGERGCGVWEVRPRLGLIGMLAGWWQLKLSSGCPLPRGPRGKRGPGLWQRSTAERQLAALAAGDGDGDGEHRREGAPLAVGHRPHGLRLGHGELGEELAAAALSPAALAHQQVDHGHAVGLPGTVEDHLRDADLARGDPALQLGAGQAHLVGAFQGTHVLR
jgi:hypothetical protein